MQIAEEIKEKKIVKETYSHNMFYKAFEDNAGAIEMARVPKMRPRTRHMNVKYH